MKKVYQVIFIFLILFQSSIFKSVAQKLFGNEWITYNQEYVKFIINSKGIYRILKSDLQNAGLDLTNKNPNNFQLFFRGKEIAINLIGGEDNSFDENDYFEFFAINNDGAQDVEMYHPKTARPHPYLSLYSTSTSYFFTISKDGLGKRMQKDEAFSTPVPEDKYYYSTILKTFDEQWNFDQFNGFPDSQLLNAYWEPNESLVSKVYRMNATENEKIFFESINLDNYEGSQSVEVETMIFSRKNTNKVIKWNIAENSEKFKISNYNYQKVKSTTNNIINSKLPITVSIESSNDFTNPQNDGFSLGYYLIKYPRKFVYKSDEEYLLASNENNRSLIRFENIPTEIYGYDHTDFENQRKLLIQWNKTTNEHKIQVENTNKNRKIWLTSTVQKPKLIIKVKFNKVDSQQHDYLIITDTKLREGANEYKKYRESVVGGNYKTIIAETKQLYDEFSYGEKNPIALVRYLDFFKTKGKPKFVLLVGKAYSIPYFLKAGESADFVPTIGFPASDYLLSTGFEDSTYKGYIPTGRISTDNNTSVIDYLNKVKEYECNKSDNFWRKNFLQLSGGADANQIKTFKELLNSLGEKGENSYIGAKYKTITKTTETLAVENIDITQEINNGVGFLTFCGHSSANVIDLNIGLVSDQKLNFKNKGFYPFMFFNGCSAAGIFGTTKTPLTTNWITTPDKGAIGILAHSYYSFSSVNATYMNKFYDTWFSSKEMIIKPIGEIIKATNENILTGFQNDEFLVANVHQLILQGDPSIQVYKFTKPDFQINDENIILTSKNINKSIADNDEINLSLVINNKGLYEKNSKFNINLKKTYLDGKSNEENLIINSFPNIDTLSYVLKKDFNLKNVSFYIDIDKKIDESDENNNSSTISFNWENLKTVNYFNSAAIIDKLNPILVVKLNNSLVTKDTESSLNPILEITLKDENSLGYKTDNLEVLYSKICDNCVEVLEKLNLGQITGAPNEIFSKIILKDFLPGDYQFYIQGFDQKKNPSGEAFTFKLKINDNYISPTINVFPNPMTLATEFQVISNLKNNLTNINYELNIFDFRGTLVNTIQLKSISEKTSIFWSGTDKNGQNLPNGPYIYKLTIDSEDIKSYKTGKINIFK